MYKYKQRTESNDKKSDLEEGEKEPKQLEYPDIENEKNPTIKSWKQKDYAIKHPILKNGTFGKMLTGFSETIGPTRANPATHLQNDFWTYTLTTIIQKEKKKREELLKKIIQFYQYPSDDSYLDSNGKWVPDTKQDEDKNRELKKTIDSNLSAENKKIQLIESILPYPENSHYENYLLLSEFLNDRDIDEIWKWVQSKINELKATNEILKKVDKRRFLSLIEFISRNSSKRKELNELLKKNFFDMKNNKDTSNTLSNIFIIFFKSKEGSLFLSECIHKLNENTMGNLIWNIYKNEFLSKERNTRQNNILSKQFKDTTGELTEEMIMKRTIQWLTMESPDRTITSYIFDIYSDYEREIIMNEKKVCKEIADLTKSLTKYKIPNLELSKKFIMDNMNSYDFIEENGPNVTKSTQKNRRSTFFQGKIKTRKNYK